MKLPTALLFCSSLLCVAPVMAEDPAALDLGKKNGCLACHALDKKLVGPSWSEVGKKYANDSAAEAKLITKVKKGGAGVWGTVPMPPNVSVKDADIKTLIQYVLSLK